jgi:hypothetical protein
MFEGHSLLKKYDYNFQMAGGGRQNIPEYVGIAYSAN